MINHTWIWQIGEAPDHLYYEALHNMEHVSAVDNCLFLFLWSDYYNPTFNTLYVDVEVTSKLSSQRLESHQFVS